MSTLPLSSPPRLSLRKALIPLGLALAAFALPTLPAHAGHWVVSYEMDGTTKQNIADGNGDISEAWPTFSSTAPSFYILDTYCYGLADTKEENISGSVTAIFTWTPDNANDASVPPQNLYVEEDSNANAFDQYIVFDQDGNDYDLGILPNVNDGLDDASIPMIIDPTWHNPADCYGYAVSSGSHVRMYPTNGQTVVKLPKRTLKADVKVDKNDLIVNDWSYLEDEFQCAELDAQVTYNAQEDTNLPKSVVIGGSTQEYVGGEWKGKGDTRFSNDVYDSLFGEDRTCVGGENFGPVNWSAGLIGSPWPPYSAFVEPPFSSSDQWTYDTFTRNWSWSGAGSDSGNTYDIHSLVTQRPHVNWPYKPDQGDPPRDLLEQMDSPRVPPTQTQQVTLTLTDTDARGQNPQWNFNGTAQSTLTFHNEYELIQADHSVTVPPTENPWIKLLFKGTNSDIQTPGQYNSWSPTIYYEAGTNWDFHVNGAWWSGGGGGSTNQGMNVSPPLNPDGSEIPFDGKVVRPRGGFGTNDIDLKIFTFGQNDPYPGVIYHD